MKTAEIPRFQELSDLERLALADEILGTLREPESLPSPAWHGAELARRWQDFESGGSSPMTRQQFWAEVERLKK
ncbi:addiction module protein [Actomonas aquatica]|uniref:Addiction module protein n=1 Tax=Actomonas aquatica TaxID=2866162 RepID=A0ABZ1C720_9BACT|nr:addiction module protein [Opitutus sp. WL0086]WRQ87522.1 addiction module protein [Opitutus sp. WL0086]